MPFILDLSISTVSEILASTGSSTKKVAPSRDAGAFSPQASAVHLDQLAADGQTETGAADLARVEVSTWVNSWKISSSLSGGCPCQSLSPGW